MGTRLTAVAVGLGLIAWTAPPVRADAPEQISYQGVLTFTDGTTVEDGTYTMEFEIFDDPVAGNLEFHQQLSVAVQDGLYNVLLSSNGPYVLPDAFDGSVRYMQVRVLANPAQGVPADVDITPRQSIASVPFALVANKARELEPPPPDPLPPGAIILWDSGPDCPEGFTEDVSFTGLLIRGRDHAGDADIPDDPGRACAAPSPDPGCGGAPARYDDVLDLSEVAEHTHDVGANTQHESNSHDQPARLAAGYDHGAGWVTFTFSPALQGGDEPHYHPFRTVAFCRKD